MNALWKRFVGLTLAVLVGLVPVARAQGGGALSQQELDRILAPVALYPDALLSQILMASTYPLEVVQAARWVQASPGLSGAALDRALEQEPWDPSVKALAPFPQVLEMMSERLEWTQRLGDAVLAQQDQVMDTVQQLRRRAHEAGNLSTNGRQRVLVQPEVIVIEPADPEVVYVPVYNPSVVYGAWWWPAAPYGWYPRGYVVSSGLVAGISFGLGIAVSDYLWGGFDWHHHDIHVHRHREPARNITVNRHVNLHPAPAREADVRRWQHDPSHRHGLRYREPQARERFTGIPGGQPVRRVDAKLLQQRLRAPRVEGGPQPERSRSWPSGRTPDRSVPPERPATLERSPRADRSVPRDQSVVRARSGVPDRAVGGAAVNPGRPMPGAAVDNSRSGGARMAPSGGMAGRGGGPHGPAAGSRGFPARSGQEPAQGHGGRGWQVR